MIHLRLLTMLAITPALFLSVSTASANTVYGTPADLTGVRSVGVGLDVIDARKPGKGRAGDWSNGMVTWTITPDAGGYLYEYELSGFNGPPAVSHFVVDLTNEALDESGIVTDATVDGGTITPADIIIGDVEGLIGAVKFNVGANDESGSVTYRFRSTRSPVWGHVAVEAGQEQAGRHPLPRPEHRLRRPDPTWDRRVHRPPQRTANLADPRAHDAGHARPGGHGAAAAPPGPTAGPSDPGSAIKGPRSENVGLGVCTQVVGAGQRRSDPACLSYARLIGRTTR